MPASVKIQKKLKIFYGGCPAAMLCLQQGGAIKKIQFKILFFVFLLVVSFFFGFLLGAGWTQSARGILRRHTKVSNNQRRATRNTIKSPAGHK